MKSSDTPLFIRYSALNFGYWVDNLMIFSFAAVLLTGRGFSAAAIGYVTTLAALLTIVLQTSLSSLADRSRRVSLKQIMAALMAGGVAAAGIMALLPRSFVAGFVCMFTAMALTNTLTPLITSLCLQYNAAGHHLNFGLARSIGSLGYAIGGYVMGQVTEAMGTEIILPIYCVLHTLLLALVLSMEKPGPALGPGKAAVRRDSSSLAQFFRRYRRYDFYLITVMLLFFMQMIHNTYMIYFVRHYGGDNADMGVLLSMCAFAELPAIALGETLRRRFSMEAMLRVAALSGPVKFAAMLFLPNVKWFIGIQALQFFYSGVFMVASVYFVDSIVGREDAVKAQGIMAVGISGISSMAANLCGGLLLERVSIQTLLLIGTGITLTAAIMMFFVTDNRLFRTASPLPEE